MNPKPMRAVVVALLVCSWSSVLSFEALAVDWPQWRGPDRDGRSSETGLLVRWPAGGPPRLWVIEGAGDGYSSMAISSEVLVTMGAENGQEFIGAWNATTGARLWSTPHGPAFRNDQGDGPRGTPTVVGDRLYALGGNGNFSCLELKSGRVLWTSNVLRRFGGRNIRWGMSESPLVEGNLVLVNAGGRGASVVAFDRRDGNVVWKSQNDPAGYSSGIVAEVGGQEQAIFFTGRRALGLRLEDGGLLWDYSRVANRTANAATPILQGDRVFLSSDYGTGCALLELESGPDGVRAQEVYFNRDMRNHHSSSVLVDKTLYGFSSHILTAMEFDSGAVAWKDRSVGKGSLIYADGHLYLFSERGLVALVEASASGYREKGRFQLPRSQRPTWSHPVLANGRLYLRAQGRLYAFDVRAQ